MTINHNKFLLSLALALTPIWGFTQSAESADEIVGSALTALQSIDRSQTDVLWNQTSAFVKAKMPQKEFVQGIQQARSRYGATTGRSWAGVMRIKYQPGSIDPPEGMYANVDFATSLADGKTIFEKVTLRLEPNGWRMIGYVPRDQQ